jgi:hypothetical protein
MWLRPPDPNSVTIASVNEMISGISMTPIEAGLVLGAFTLALIIRGGDVSAPGGSDVDL